MKQLTLIFLFLSLLIFKYAHAINIVFDNKTLSYNQTYTTGINQHADISHIRDNFQMIRFYVEGAKGKHVVVDIHPNQSINNKSNSEKLNISHIHFDCGLSNRGTAQIRANGRTDLLCIGARIKISASIKAGIYTGSIPFEVTYK